MSIELIDKIKPKNGGSFPLVDAADILMPDGQRLSEAVDGFGGGNAAAAVSAHNVSPDAHNDIRLLVAGLTSRLSALANSDDTTLDQMAEVVAYIKSNRDLIDAITTGKVSVADIVDNLTTSVANKPLSAKQGVALKTLIDNIQLQAGQPGKSAYEIAVENGFQGQEQDWLESLKGETGEAGAPGQDGTNGTNGTDGVGIQSVTQTTTSTADGGENVVTVTLSNGQKSTFNVKNGSKGSAGANGKDGATGPQGPQGIQGATGAKGDKGDKGDTGATGPKGDTGATGPQGPSGENGTATDAQVAAWLTEHPEATTTVQDKSIGAFKLSDDLAVSSTNLFDSSTIGAGYFKADGSVAGATSGRQHSTQYIPVTPGKSYAWTSTMLLACTYNSSKTLIERLTLYTSSAPNPGPNVFNDGVAFVRLSTYDTAGFPNNFVFSEGVSPAAYEPYGRKLRVEEQVTAISEQMSAVEETQKVKGNLINKSQIVAGYINSDGSYSASSLGYRTDNYIPVQYGKNYAWNTGDVRTISTYDENKLFIERLVYSASSTQRVYTFGENVKFVRLSMTNIPFPDDAFFVQSDYPYLFISAEKNYIKTDSIIPFSVLLDENIVWFGDSISALRDLPQRVAEIMQCKVTDTSIPGLTLTGMHTNSNYTALSVLELIKSKIANNFTSQRAALTAESKDVWSTSIDALESVDISQCTSFVIFAGTNDHITNEDTFKAKIREMMTAIFTNYPHITVYVISTIYRGDGTDAEQEVALTEGICREFNVPFYDLYHNSCINNLTIGHWLNADKLHPNANGEILLSKKISKYLMSH